MGCSYEVVCPCGHQFRVSLGGGFHFELLYCDRCGKSKSVKRLKPCGEVAPYKDRCRCGGRYDPNARPQCPACGSTDWRQAPDRHLIMYD